MATFRVVAPRETLDALIDALGTSDLSVEAISVPAPDRPVFTSRSQLRQQELWSLLISFGVGVGSSAAYDLLLAVAARVGKIERIEPADDDEQNEDASAG